MKEGGGVLPISFFWLLRNQLSQLVSFLAAEDARRVTHSFKMGGSVHFWQSKMVELLVLPNQSISRLL